MDVIKEILVEVRSRLQSCSVTLLTEPNFVDDYHLKVSIQPNLIIVNYSEYESKKLKKIEPSRSSTRNYRKDSTSSCESFTDSEDESYDFSKFINVGHHCKLLPSSLSSLKIENEFISFRVLTDPSNRSTSDTFFNETITENTSPDDVYDLDRPVIGPQKSEKFSLKCSNCKNVLSDENGDGLIEFERILELPSDNLDISEWFCHGSHSHGGETSEPCVQVDKLGPRHSDLLYGPCYYLVNFSKVKSQFLKFNEKRSLVCHCDRCLSWIGTKSKDSCKFWNSTVLFDRRDDTVTRTLFDFYQYSNPNDSKTPLNDFLYIIKLGIRNSFVSAVSSSCKLLLECKTKSDKSDFVVIWVMDKRLNVLRSERSEDPHEIKLKAFSTSKLLYKICGDASSVKGWNDDSAVQSFEISKSMFAEGCKHFAAMASYIPHSFKKTNDFLVTYLEI